MQVFEELSDLRSYVAGRKKDGRKVVFVPTMGALHEGHGACVRTGQAETNQALVVSIYVNPTQFAPGEDFDRYPKTLETDLDMCRSWGVDAVFCPQQTDMYPENRPGPVWVTVETITETMCGASRAGHFRGVATVVAKLFNMVQPDVAVFGQKDAQQALVIREMVKQLAWPVELKIAPIDREPDGLARSSRNRYLSDLERADAVAIYRTLGTALERIRSGERDPGVITAAVRNDLSAFELIDVEYAELRKAADLSVLETIDGSAILAVAARVGATRLIDNIVFRIKKDGSIEQKTLFQDTQI